MNYKKQISIHAPPRGATGRELIAAQRHISIHAPPRGATLFLSEAMRRTADFNSRPSARGDACVFPPRNAMRISIHAPPRGATKY